jgi:hypothetical protein
VILGLENAASQFYGSAASAAASSDAAPPCGAPRLFSPGHIMTVSLAPFSKASMQWPVVRGLFDFRNDQWADKLSELLSPAGFARNPYWTSRNLAECLPAAQARFLRASRKHLLNVHLVAVTADAVPTFGDAAVAYPRYFSHRSVRDQSLRILGTVLGGLGLLEAPRRRGAARYLVAAWALLLARLRGTSQARAHRTARTRDQPLRARPNDDDRPC